MILGVGADLVDVARFERVATRHGEGFVERILTPEEIADCARSRRPFEEQAVRFAAREALLKALGTGLIGGMSWRDMRVVRSDGPGVFTVEIAGGVRQAAEALGVRRLHVALCTTRTIAAAVVILEGVTS
jgi:holo-[acyl-carrier protein] synthase